MIHRRIAVLLAATALLSSAAFLGAAAAAAVKPKPWQWTAAKMNTRLMAAAPFVWDEVELQTARCVGQGKAVARRYSRFRCAISFGSNNIQPYGAQVLIRVLPVGSGKLCVVATPDGKAQPHIEGTNGIQVADGRACP